MIQAFRRFSTSPAFLLPPFSIALAGLLGGGNALLISMIINVQLVAIVLFFCDDLLPAFLTAFCIITLGATNLKVLPIFIPYIPVTVTVVAGLIFHLIRYRRPIYLGPSFWGLLATSIAILFSGIATPLASRDYGSGGAIYHLIGMTAGLVLLYLLCASNRREERGFDPLHYFLWSMFFLGLLCAAVILKEFFLWLIPNMEKLAAGKINVANKYLQTFTYRNTIATLLIMCVPSAFYLARQAKRGIAQTAFFLSGVFLYVCLLLTAARTALLFGTVMMIPCLVYYLYKNQCRVAKYINLLLLVLGGITFVWVFKAPIIALIKTRMPNGLITVGEARVKLFIRSIHDFLANPLFGAGITSTVNTDLYSAPGCICWYHMYFPQIWGSMGLLGIVTHMYQLFIRAKLVLADMNAKAIGIGLSYLALFLYSQTDTGEFTPIPYAAISVILFALLEKKPKPKQLSETKK